MVFEVLALLLDLEERGTLVLSGAEAEANDLVTRLSAALDVQKIVAAVCTRRDRSLLYFALRCVACKGERRVFRVSWASAELRVTRLPVSAGGTARTRDACSCSTSPVINFDAGKVPTASFPKRRSSSSQGPTKRSSFPSVVASRRSSSQGPSVASKRSASTLRSKEEGPAKARRTYGRRRLVRKQQEDHEEAQDQFDEAVVQVDGEDVFAFEGSSEGVVQEQQQGPEEWRTFKIFSPLSLAEESEMNRFRETASEPLLSVLDGGHVDASVVDTVLRLLCPPTAQVFPSALVASRQFVLNREGIDFWIFPFVSGFQWRLIYASRETGTVELLDPMLGTGAAKTGPALARYVAGLLTGGDWSVLLPNAFTVPQRAHKADSGLCVLYFAFCRLRKVAIRLGTLESPSGIPLMRQGLFLDLMRR